MEPFFLIYNNKFYRCFDHIATINETTSKAVKMFKSSEEDEDNKSSDDNKTVNKSDTPVLFIVGHAFEDGVGNSDEKLPPKKLSNAFEHTMKRGKVTKFDIQKRNILFLFADICRIKLEAQNPINSNSNPSFRLIYTKIWTRYLIYMIIYWIFLSK